MLAIKCWGKFRIFQKPLYITLGMASACLSILPRTMIWFYNSWYHLFYLYIILFTYNTLNQEKEKKCEKMWLVFALLTFTLSFCKVTVKLVVQQMTWFLACAFFKPYIWICYEKMWLNVIFVWLLWFSTPVSSSS